MNDNGQAIAKQASPLSHLNTFLDTRKKTLAQYAASRIKPDTLIRLALREFAENEFLRKCTPESIYSSLITAAQLGLEPGGPRGLGYLVPFKGKCQFIPGWRGLIALALRSKAVKSIYAHNVHERDEFAIELGSEPRVVHRPCLDEDRGEIIGAYAIAQLESGTIDVEWAGVAALNKIRESSQGKNSAAYTQWAEEMSRKAVIRRLCKRLPLGDDFFEAAAIDDAVESGKEPPRFDLTEAEIVSEAKPSSLASKVAAKANQVIDVVEDAS